MRQARWAPFLALSLLWTSWVVLKAEERFPPPQFTTKYQIPPTVTPPPRADWLAWLDVAVLLFALSLATWLVHRRRWRNGIFVWMLGSIAYFGFYRKGCVCPVGAIQNVALALGDPHSALPLSVALFFLLPLLFALFCGRVFCAAVCPLGAAQDALLMKPLRVPAWLEHALGLVPYIYLAGAVLFALSGSAFLICQYDPIVPFYRLSGSTLILSLGAATLLLSMFVGRPYCRFLCPYGVLLRWCALWARWTVRITPDRCLQCRLCEEACPFGAIRYPTPEPTPASRTEGRTRLALLLVALPVLVFVGGWLGARASGTLARMNATVRLADRLWLEEQGRVEGMTEESAAFRQQAQPSEELYRRAAQIRFWFRGGARTFGAWIGLVFGLKLILLSIRRRRTDYEADPAACLACGRCYLYCPQERVRLGWITEEEAAALAGASATGQHALSEGRTA